MRKSTIAGSFYKRGNLFWYERHLPGGKRIRVSTKQRDLESAIEWVRMGAFGTRTYSKPKEITKKFVAQLLHQCKSRAKAAGMNFALSVEDFYELYEAGGKHCAVTGVPFDLSTMDGANRRPYAPSIDRIDRMFGYTLDNCRIVCVAANLAMNEFGESVLWDLAASMVELRRRKLNRAFPRTTIPTSGASEKQAQNTVN